MKQIQQPDPVDRAQLAALLGDETLVDMVIGSFCASLGDSLDAVWTTARLAGDRQGLCKAAHSLAGAARMTAIAEIGNTAKTVELACRDQRPDADVRAALAGLAQAVQRFVAYYPQTRLPDYSAAWANDA